MKKTWMGRIPHTVLYAHFVRALPAEYDHAKKTLQSMKNRDRDEIIRVVSTWYFNLPQKKGAHYSISRATSIDSDCCRLPTASVLSNKADKLRFNHF